MLTYWKPGVLPVHGLPVWEEANSRGYVEQCRDSSGVTQVCVSEAGRALLQPLRHEPLPIQA